MLFRSVSQSRYSTNLQTFEERLDALNDRIHPQLTALQGKPYFIFHEAYDYFEATYGLKHANIFNVLTEVQPNTHHVTTMHKTLQQTKPNCVFSKPPLHPRLTKTLTTNLPIKLTKLNTLKNDLPITTNNYEQLLENLTGKLNKLNTLKNDLPITTNNIVTGKQIGRAHF